MNRGAEVAAVSLAILLVATMATPALAAVASPGDTSPQVNGSAVSGSGAFDIEELRRGGVHPGGGAATSTRELGDPVMGGVMVQYQPISPIQNSYSQLWHGAELRFIEGDVPETPPFLTDENKWEFIDQGPPDPFSGWMGRA